MGSDSEFETVSDTRQPCNHAACTCSSHKQVPVKAAADALQECCRSQLLSLPSLPSTDYHFHRSVTSARLDAVSLCMHMRRHDSTSTSNTKSAITVVLSDPEVLSRLYSSLETVQTVRENFSL